MDTGPVDATPLHVASGGEYDEADLTHLSEEETRPARKTTATLRNASKQRRSGLRQSLQAGLQIRVDSPGDDSTSGSAREANLTDTGRNEGEKLDDRSGSSPDRSVGAIESEAQCPRLHKFTLYETNTRYWIAGSDVNDKAFQLLRIERNSPPGQIGLFEDKTIYDARQIAEVLASIDEGNKATGGLRKKCQFWGLLGFIRFTEAYYMLIITKRQQAALIGGHYVYQIEGTELVPLTTGSSSRFMSDRNAEETRFLSILGNVDLSKQFYFSYSYDITHSLQHNIIRQRKAVNEGLREAPLELNGMFVWNQHLLNPAIDALGKPFQWCLPVIHGFINQNVLDIFGRAVYITIIGRRSRFFAGARFLKRGVNDGGHVANDVETEQIVSEKLTTSFHAPGPRLYANPTYTSYLHHRGSIPLHWTQDNSGVTPKPSIDLNLQDPFYQPAALHFDNLFQRYGCPVYVLNLIKARERTPRESKLLVELQRCIEYLNLSLPADRKILYKAFDMSRASKVRGGDVIGSLETIAQEAVAKTGFFKNGSEELDKAQVQNGIIRTNCIDCLDRTNAAQFVIGKRAFALQLQALGVIEGDSVDYDTDAINVFTHMFHDHGDTIAVQYAGSHLVNTMATYRKLNHWQSSSRDMMESFKRYYHNSFLDYQRQEAYNLFLGNYVWSHGQPMLWDLTTDYYLHHNDPRGWLDRGRRNYYTWYTPEFLKPRALPTIESRRCANVASHNGKVDEYDDYWLECYRPTALSSLEKVYSYRIAAHNKLLPDKSHRETKWDYSPFKVRNDIQHRVVAELSTNSKQRSARRGVKILDPHDENGFDIMSTTTLHSPPPSASLREETHGILRPSTLERSLTAPELVSAIGTVPSGADALAPVSLAPETFHPPDKTKTHLWTLDQFHKSSLNPSVTTDEAKEYERYIEHPLNLPLVVPNDEETKDAVDTAFLEFVQRPGGIARTPGWKLSHPGDDDGANVDGSGIAASEVSEELADEEELRIFEDWLRERENPLTVGAEDGEAKRYKAYRQWLRGRCLFK